eukprot:gene10517-11450_t
MLSEATVQKTIDAFRAENLTNVSGVIADLSSAEGFNQFINQIASSGKTVDVVVNNMGVFGTKDFFEATDQDWDNYFQVNVMSTVRAGVRPIPDMVPYSMSKAAQINIARGLAELTKGTKVTVNSLLPGPTATEGADKIVEGLAQQTGKSKEEAARGFFAEREPTSLIQRFLTVEEVANTALFLASDLSSGINGAAQLVEGGIIRAMK